MRGQSEMAARLEAAEPFLSPATSAWHAPAHGADLRSASAANENTSPRFTFSPEHIAGWCAC